MSPRTATTAMFLVHGAALGSWAAHIPFVQERFELSNGVLGLVLLASSAGVIVATAAGGQVIARVGSERALRVFAPLCAGLLVFPLLAPHPALTALALLAMGSAAGAMDVSMNAHGVRVEERLERPIMSSLHAGWSFGALGGAGVAALATAAGIDPRVQVPAAALVLSLVVLACLGRLGPGALGAGGGAPAFALPGRGVLGLALICLLVMLTEGAMIDWSGVYLRQELAAAPAVAAAGFAALACGMTTGRLIGDALTQRLGPVLVVRGGAALAGTALAVALLAAQPVVTLVAVALVGLGVANGVPLVFSAAGRSGDPGPAIAAVSATGSVAFLAGPPFIGFAADLVGLPLALASLCLAAVAVAALAPRAARAPVGAGAAPAMSPAA